LLRRRFGEHLRRVFERLRANFFGRWFGMRFAALGTALSLGAEKGERTIEGSETGLFASGDTESLSFVVDLPAAAACRTLSRLAKTGLFSLLLILATTTKTAGTAGGTILQTETTSLFLGDIGTEKTLTAGI